TGRLFSDANYHYLRDMVELQRSLIVLHLEIVSPVRPRAQLQRRTFLVQHIVDRTTPVIRGRLDRAVAKETLRQAVKQHVLDDVASQRLQCTSPIPDGLQQRDGLFEGHAPWVLRAR